MHRARAELNAQSDSNEHPTIWGTNPSPAFWEPPCLDAACALHILILSFGLYGDLPSHNNPYVFFGHTGDNRHRPFIHPIAVGEHPGFIGVKTAGVCAVITPGTKHSNKLASNSRFITA